MLAKWLKRGLIGTAAIGLIGGLLFGKDLASYVSSGHKWAQAKVKESVPVDFELKRARDLLEEIIPEMHANVKMIAQEEVELASLKAEISDSEKSFNKEKDRVAGLRKAMLIQQASYNFNGKTYTRQEVTEELAGRFDRLKEAEMLLESKKRLMATRENALKASMQLLEKTKSQKVLLAGKIDALESKYRLVKATQTSSGINTIDNSKLAQTEKLINDIKKRLDVAERVLAHESTFIQNIDVEEVNEQELLEQVNTYFDGEPVNTETNPDAAYASTEVTTVSQ